MPSLPDVRAGDNGVPQLPGTRTGCRRMHRQGGPMHPTLLRALESPIQANALVALCDCSRYAQSTKGRSSAEIFADLNDLYALIDDSVDTAGGHVVKFIGDGALIVFPEDLADQGIIALLDLKTKTDRWMQDRRLGDSLFINAHVGEVTLGRMGRAGS